MSSFKYISPNISGGDRTEFYEIAYQLKRIADNLKKMKK